jgi:hypothetical protein
MVPESHRRTNLLLYLRHCHILWLWQLSEGLIMQTIKKLSASEAFAVNQWLSDMPDHWSYKQIIAYLNRTTWLGRESKITPWELVENCTGEDIAVFIDDTRLAFERATQSEGLI